MSSTPNGFGVSGVSVNGSAGSIAASAGIAQDILDLQVQVQNGASQSLTVTLTVGGGVLTDGPTTASTLLITAPNQTALNQELSGLVYTANIATTADTLTLSNASGLDALIPIVIEPVGTIAAFSQLPTGGQTALFAGSGTLESQPAAPGAIIVTGTAEFDDLLAVNGISGTALLIDAGGAAVFDAASQVELGSNVTVGDGGSGTLSIETPDFQIDTANLVIGSSTAAAGSVVEATGGLTVAGNLVVGEHAASQLALSGVLDAVATTIDAAGMLIAGASATASFGGLVNAGTLVLEGSAQATAANLDLTGALRISGNSRLTGLSSAVIGGSGQLSVAAGADFGTSLLNAIGGGISIAGLLVAGDFLADSGVSLSGGTLNAAIATLGSGGVLSGFGEVVLSGAGAKLALAGGDIIASGGTLVLDGNVTISSGSLEIAGSAALDLIEAAGGQVVFEAADSELIINDIGGFSAAVSGMIGHDVIDLVGIVPSLVSYSAGVISADGNHFALTAASGQPAVEILADGSGGALITLGGEMACFARGTRLLTPNGYVPVEVFKPGDPIINKAGAKKAVRWIGRRVLDIGLKPRVDDLPVLVMPGAFGPGCPREKIRLSAPHAIFLDGVLVPAMHLVNGATILRERKTGPISYYHIELDRHDVLMAEGLPVESYLDTGNRGQFEDESGVRGVATQLCAPLVAGGPVLAAIRRRLHEIALRAGFTLVRDPELRGLAGDLKLLPEFSLPGTARFALPPDTGRLLLFAKCAAPADTDPGTDDRRELGICLNPSKVKRDRLRLGAGWYRKASGDAGIWMGGSGEVFVPPGATALTLRLAAVAQSWCPPD